MYGRAIHALRPAPSFSPHHPSFLKQNLQTFFPPTPNPTPYHRNNPSPQNPMATHQEIRQYLTHWFQLGKPLILNGTPHTITPTLNTDRPSPEFETLWQQILKTPHLAHLEGSEIDLAQLLSGTWDIIDCARCEMPIPLKIAGIIDNHCICQDMTTWPNNDTLQPHSPIDTTDKLQQLRDRLIPSS